MSASAKAPADSSASGTPEDRPMLATRSDRPDLTAMSVRAPRSGRSSAAAAKASSVGRPRRSTRGSISMSWKVWTTHAVQASFAPWRAARARARFSCAGGPPSSGRSGPARPCGPAARRPVREGTRAGGRRDRAPWEPCRRPDFLGTVYPRCRAWSAAPRAAAGAHLPPLAPIPPRRARAPRPGRRGDAPKHSAAVRLAPPRSRSRR